ncbi:hypothetical protein KCP70_08965 [Salmonella enterica subsp. enterica]|nr:hypothetical protein KCP70_08965 [Salmonella enterica subsp. enterica]
MFRTVHAGIADHQFTGATISAGADRSQPDGLLVADGLRCRWCAVVEAIGNGGKGSVGAVVNIRFRTASPFSPLCQLVYRSCLIKPEPVTLSSIAEPCLVVVDDMAVAAQLKRRA